MKCRVRLEFIEWVDSNSYGRWTDSEILNKNAKNMVCQSVGWRVSESDDNVTLVATMSAMADQEHVDVNLYNHGICDMTIPKCAILKRKILKWK